MTAGHPFWLASEPLVLASGSAARRSLLEAAAIPFTVVPAQIDERAIEEPLLRAGVGPAEVARCLAEAKAMAVSRIRPAAIVLGGDQVLALGERLFIKPTDVAEARRTLEVLSGRTHTLHVGWAVARAGAVLRAGVADARLTMRALTPAFLDAYMDAEGDALCTSVGAYRLEGLGIHLFEQVEGDHATILGLPMLPVLAALRETGALQG